MASLVCLWDALGFLWGDFGSPWADFGALGLNLDAVGLPLGVLWLSWDISSLGEFHEQILTIIDERGCDSTTKPMIIGVKVKSIIF